MILSKLFDGIEYEFIQGDMNVVVKDISYDSRYVKDNDVFLCIDGIRSDGHDYAETAVANGAKCLVVTKDVNISGVTIIKVKDIRKIMSKITMKLFDYPQNKLVKIAITGTKGKTTTSFMINSILSSAKLKCGIIGTNGVYIGEKFYPSKNTTPESYDTLKYMKEMADKKIKYVVMEVSSQALKYDRVCDIHFDYGIFTNLTHDHIGENEHESMEDYIQSKAKLFSQSTNGIFNLDDDHFFEMVSIGDSSIETYGYSDKADLKAESIELIREKNFIGINLKTSGIINDTFKISLPGKFSSYNALAAIMTCHLLGVDVKYMKEALSNFHVVGRVEQINVSDKFTLICDYAHNGISTESILTTIKEYNPQRIVTIFGCGGNRSKDRRYEMGEIAGKYSDFCIITEDNNRYEEFDDIANDILVGMKKTSCEYIIISDRKDAIAYAIKNGKKGDIIMLLGKGHENYKEIKGVRYPFDERVIIKEILDEIK